jgi:hypothetical protein
LIVLIANYYYYRAICYSNSSRSSILEGASGEGPSDPSGSRLHCHAFHPISGRVRNAPKKVTRPPLGPLPPPNLHVTGPKNQNPMRRSAVRRSTQPSFIAKANNEEIRLARSACRHLQPTYFRMVTSLPTEIPLQASQRRASQLCHLPIRTSLQTPKPSAAHATRTRPLGSSSLGSDRRPV